MLLIKQYQQIWVSAKYSDNTLYLSVDSFSPQKNEI